MAGHTMIRKSHARVILPVAEKNRQGAAKRGNASLVNVPGSVDLTESFLGLRKTMGSLLCFLGDLGVLALVFATLVVFLNWSGRQLNV